MLPSQIVRLCRRLDAIAEANRKAEQEAKRG